MYIVQGFLGRSRSVQADVNSSTGDVSRSYRWSATDLWAEEISRDLLRFGFLIFSGYWRTRLSSDFGEFVLAGRAGFSLRISEIDKSYRTKICVSCVLMIHL
jgi:hypothetical protein